MGTWQDAQNTKNTAIHALARAVAQEMGEGWKAQANKDGDGNPAHYAIVTRPDGGGFHMMSAWKGDGKIYISAEWPKDPDGHGGANWCVRYNETSPSIQVSETRGAAVIAKEIKRRFLPLYDPMYARAVNQREGAIKARSTADSIAESIATALGGRRIWKGHSGTDAGGEISIPSDEINTDGLPVSGSVKVSYGGAVEFRLDVDPAQALALCEWIKTQPTTPANTGTDCTKGA